MKQKLTKKISFIIPCYNVEKFISQTLDSILNLDYEHTGFEYEILCIIDKCTDKTEKIVRKYSENYPNIRIFKTEYNRAGLNRNVGIEYATGDYIWFVDGDDKVLPNCLYYFQQYLFYNPDAKLFHFKYLLSSNYNMGFSKGAVWGYLFRKDIFEDEYLRFGDEEVHEDDNFMEKILLRITPIEIPTAIYYYRYPREGSLIWNHLQKQKES